MEVILLGLISLYVPLFWRKLFELPPGRPTERDLLVCGLGRTAPGVREQSPLLVVFQIVGDDLPTDVAEGDGYFDFGFS